MNESLRQVMIAAEGSGELAGEAIGTGRAEHPVCGDVVAVDVRWSGDVIEDVAWRASGCPACMAVAAAAPAAWRGVSRAQAPGSLHRRLSELGGLSPHERHAERLLLEALDRAWRVGLP